MERRDQVSRLQAELVAKKLELAQLQQRVRKAEVSRRSQQSGGDRSGRADRKHTNQQDNEKSHSYDMASSRASQGLPSSQASQGLVRALNDPHSPVWISGQLYPAQYLIRQTRSMSKAQGEPSQSLVKLKLPPTNVTLQKREFELPDDMFLHLKEEKLQRCRHTYSNKIFCELVESSYSLVQLQCNGVITCLEGKVSTCEAAGGKLVVGRGGTFLALFNDSLVVCERGLGGRCNSHPLAKAVNSFDFICTRNGVSVIAVAHSGELLVLILTANNWKNVPLSTDHLDWPNDYHCHLLSVSDFGDDSVHVAASCSEVASVWNVNMAGNCTSTVICCVSTSLISSLLMVEDLLMATTSQHELLICSATRGSVANRRRIPLSCCTTDLPATTDMCPKLLAAKKYNEVLVIMLMHQLNSGGSNTDSGVDIAGWIIAVKDDEGIPYLLHTYRLPQSTCNKQWALYVHSHPERGWDLVGVAEKTQLIVWKGRQECPSETVNVRATEGACVSGVVWDTTSDSCLVLDKFQQVHCFQNTHIL